MLTEPADFAEMAMALLEEPDVAETLDGIIEYARDCLECDHAGIHIVRNRQIETAAATDEVIRHADKMQTELGEGPCLQAVWDKETFVVDDTVDRRAVADVRQGGRRPWPAQHLQRPAPRVRPHARRDQLLLLDRARVRRRRRRDRPRVRPARLGRAGHGAARGGAEAGDRCAPPDRPGAGHLDGAVRPHRRQGVRRAAPLLAAPQHQAPGPSPRCSSTPANCPPPRANPSRERSRSSRERSRCSGERSRCSGERSRCSGERSRCSPVAWRRWSVWATKSAAMRERVGLVA